MKKSKTFQNILISYLVIMLIPTMILSGLLFNFFQNTFTKELITNQINTLQRLRTTIDSEINEMDAHAIQMLNLPLFSPLYLEEAYGNFFDVTQHLASVSFTNSFISDVCYINPSLSTVFTKQTMYSYADFSKFGPGYSVLSDHPENTLNLLMKNRKRYWLGVQQTGSVDPRYVLTYVVTNKLSEYPPTASILFRIDRRTLDALMANITPGVQSNFIIGDTDENILYSSSSLLDDDMIAAYRSLPHSSEPTSVQINQKTYIAFKMDSLEGSLSYTSFLPYEQITQPIASYRRTVFAILFGISVLCLIVIIYSMRINYAPVRAMSHLITSELGNSESDSLASTEEFEAARELLLSVNERDRGRKRERITLRLMRGHYKTLTDLEEAGASLGYPLAGPFFQVITFYIGAQSDSVSTEYYEEIAALIESNLIVHMHVCIVCYSETTTIYAVVSGEEAELEHLSPSLKQLQEVIASTFSASMSIGVGSMTRIDAVSSSATQSELACEYKFLRGKDAVTFYKDIANSSSNHSYPVHVIDALYHAILHGDRERITFATDTLVQHISQTRSLFFATCIAYDILNTAIKATQQLNCTVTVLSDMNLEQRAPLHSMEEIVSIVNAITDQVVQLVDGQEQDEAVIPVSRLDQVKQYIAENFCDAEFSVKTLADHFQMSASNLSHYFKKQTGETLSKYISMLRFERAKTLLRTTDMTLMNIVPLCGYLNLSTLMRQFKQWEDCTPASYRARFRG